MVILRNRVRELRTAQGLTLRELAQAADVHFTTISRLELQRGRCNDEAKIRIARALKTNVADLFFPDDGNKVLAGKNENAA